MKPPKFRYVRAETTEHAVELLAEAGSSARILAGGQSLIPALSARSVTPSLLVDVMRCPGLDKISQTPGEITLGAACRQWQIEWSPVIRQSLPLLSETLGWVAMPQVRSRGTVVGCLAQANPGGEVPVVSLALDAVLSVHTHGHGLEKMSARDVYDIESGTRLPSSSMIVSASFPELADGEGWGFCEIQLREGHFALVCCAATLSLDENGCVRSARIAIGGLTHNPYRAARAEKAIIGEYLHDDSLIREAAHTASAERPWPARADLHATGNYRSKVAVTAVARALMDARKRCSSPTGKTNG